MSGPERPERFGPPPRRVRVTSPRRQAVRRGPARSPSADLDEQTALGQVYLTALLRAHLRVAVTVLGATALGMGTVALLFVFVPEAHTVTVGAVPLSWLVLGLFSYVLLFAAAVACRWAGERVESEFVRLLRRE